jgi:adenylate kinase
MSRNSEIVKIPRKSTVSVLAPPSSGKGTFCKLLRQKIHALHVSTGEILRGLQDPDISVVMSKGQLAEDCTMLSILEKHVSKNLNPDSHQVLLLDGFPRNTKQVEMLEQVSLGHIFLVHLKIGDTEVLKRFTNSLQDDSSDRANRLDNDIQTFMYRLNEYRRMENFILNAARSLNIPVIKREISNTKIAAELFYRKHIAPHHSWGELLNQ